MATVNVRRDVSDPFYRYKMERIQTKIEGKGNGIKTVVVNLSSVAVSLARPGSYLIKYFGFELGAQTNIDPADDRWIINGAHEAQKLQELLDGFISKFVLCKKCKNPETEVQIKDGHITLDCKACGQRTEVDLRHKLSGFILKNVPKKTKKDKAERKAARKAKQNGNGDNKNGNGSGGDEGSDQASPNGEIDIASDDDALTRKIKTEAQNLETKAAEDKEETWAVDTSAEAVKARLQSLPGEFKQKIDINVEEDDEEGGANNVYNTLGSWIEEEVKAKGGVAELDEIQIYLKAKELGIETKHKTLTVLAQTIFDENIVKQIKKRAPMLKQIGTSERHEKALLGGIESLLANLGEEHYKQIVPILMALYNEELITEEVVSKWGTKASKKYAPIAASKKIRKAAAPFLEWLENAESEEESEDDE